MKVPALTRGAVTVGAVAATGATLHSLLNLRQLRRPARTPAPVTRSVSVLVPARNEGAHITECARAILASTGCVDLQLVIADDNSTDDTALLVAAIDDTRITLLSLSGEPPAGWLGKPYACQRLSDNVSSDILVFIDADVVVTKAAIAAAVELLERSQLDLISPYPRQLAEGALPRLIQPLLQWSWATFLPLGWSERSTRESLAVANGQFLVCSREAYVRAGGHAAVRDKVFDDIELARAFVRRGMHAAVVDGTTLATCRMYGSDRELLAGYEKSLWTAFGGPVGGTVAALTLALMYLLPPIAAIGSRDSRTRGIGLVGYGVAVVGRMAVAGRTGGRSWPDSLAHPASIAVFVALLARSHWAARNGTRTWRGRTL